MSPKVQASSGRVSSSSDHSKEDPLGSRRSTHSIDSVNSGVHDSILAEVKQMRQSQMMEDKKMQMRVMQDRMGASAKVNLSDVRVANDCDDVGYVAYLRWWCRRIIVQQKFDTFMGIVILLNSICIGLESEFELQNLDTSVFKGLEHLFLAIYVVELLMRFAGVGRSCLTSNWVRFDLALVAQGIITDWIIAPFMGDATVQGLGPLLVVRVLRLMRLARALRLLVQFQALWALVRGFLSSLGTMIYSVFLMTLMIYLFACLGTEIITKGSSVQSDPELSDIVEDSFSSLPMTMLTLMQFITSDSVAAIYGPMIRKQPYLLLYFVGFMVIVNITLMNLITAVIVQGAIENGKADREVKLAVNKKKRDKMVPRIRAIFDRLDQDKGGTVTLEEVAGADGRMKEELLDLVQSDNIVELFELLDIDGSGELDIQEFIDGIMMAVTSDTPIEFVRMQKQLVHIREKTMTVEKALTTVVEQVGAHGVRMKHITGQMRSMDKTLTTICQKLGVVKEDPSVESPMRCMSYGPV